MNGILLSSKYSPDTVIEIIDEIISKIHDVNEIADIDISHSLSEFSDKAVGRIIRRAPKLTKSQENRYYIKRDFDLETYIKSLDIFSVINLDGLGINLGGKYNLPSYKKLGLHEKIDNIAERNMNNLLCKYQASLIISVLASVLDQYLYFLSNPHSKYRLHDDVPKDVFKYYGEFSNSEYAELKSLIVKSNIEKQNTISYIAHLALFCNYEQELVKIIVSTKFLNLCNSGSEHHMVFNSLDKYCHHEYKSSYRNADHESKLRLVVYDKIKL